MSRHVAVGIGLAICLVLVLVLGSRGVPDRQLAWVADRTLGLDERLSSALEAHRGEVAGRLAGLQLADTERAATAAGWSGFDAHLRRSLAGPLAALMLAALGVAGSSWWPQAGSSPPTQATRQDVAEAAATMAALAEQTGDETLEAVAETLDELARAMTSDVLSEQQTEILASQLAMLSEDQGRADAAWEALEAGSFGLAERVASAAPAKPNPYATGHGTQANSGTAGAITEIPEPQGGSSEVRIANLPGGTDTGESAGLPLPPEGVEADALGDEEGYSADNLPPMTGSASGAGEGQSNMAGSGSEPDATALAAAPPAAAGFDATRTLQAESTAEGRRVRTSDVTEARRTEQAATQARSDWPAAASEWREPQQVPEHARATVQRLFDRPEYVP